MTADKGKKKQSGADLRWWLTQGAESCDGCAAMVNAEAVAHCHDCDCALCPLCQQNINEPCIVLCPECAGVPPEEQH